MKTESKAKKTFVKPAVKKHTAIAQIAGSGYGNCVYAALWNGTTYYH